MPRSCGRSALVTAGVVIVIFHTVKVGFRLCNDTNTAADPDVVFSLIVELLRSYVQ